MTIQIQDFFRLRDSMPVVDVRSEGEFDEGHIAQAVNIPILNNVERKEVGTDYKQKGQEEAIKTGFRVAGPRFPDIIEHTKHVAAGNELLVHCWRGGLRSRNYCEIVEGAGVKTNALAGGYKVYRQAAVDSFKRPLRLIVIGGYTGSGKSEVLRELRNHGEQVIDLEDLAHHKGSAFGGLMMPPQPTTEQFQNDLFEVIHSLDITRRIWVEDESLAVGKIFLPDDFWRSMLSSSLVEMSVDKEVRIKRLVKEYGPADKALFLESMVKITKKLGGQHFNTAKEKLLQDDMATTIDILLTYYDKAYQTGLVSKKDRIKAKVEWDGLDAAECARRLIDISI